MSAKQMDRRGFLKTSGLAALSLAAGACSRTGNPTPRNKALRGRPNFLILKSDEHNPLISSIEGHPFVKTPNMERLAERGTVFDNACCPSPLCVPARSAFVILPTLILQR